MWLLHLYSLLVLYLLSILLLVLFKKQYLLDLLWGQILLEHFLLSRHAIVFNLLLASLDL